MNETMVHEQEKEKEKTLMLSEEAVTLFLNFLENRSEYLDTGLGAFHTDNHSNW